MAAESFSRFSSPAKHLGPSLERLVERAWESARKRVGLHRPHPLRWLEPFGIRTVVDAGANTGQFAKEVRSLLPEAKILSFEPLADCQQALRSAFAHDRNFESFPFALGAEEGTTTIFRSQHSQSSSLRPMAHLHKEAFPYTAGGTQETIQVRRLDDVLAPLTLEEPLLVKIDVQGFEDQVIQGGQTTLARARVALVELSVEPLYDNQPLFHEVYERMVALGFRFRGAHNQLFHPQDGRVLQVDGIFTRDT